MLSWRHAYSEVQVAPQSLFAIVSEEDFCFVIFCFCCFVVCLFVFYNSFCFEIYSTKKESILYEYECPAMYFITLRLYEVETWHGGREYTLKVREHIVMSICL